MKQDETSAPENPHETLGMQSAGSFDVPIDGARSL